MRIFVSPTVTRVLTSVAFRLLVAVVLVGWHVATTASFAKERFGLPFNAAPQAAPRYLDPAHDSEPQDGRRLVVTRWDGLHYLALALRGYSQCPPHVRHGESPGPGCDASFYPGYPALGWLVQRVFGMGMDYALWSVSLAASVLTLFLWTDRAVVSAVGLGGAYATLLVHNFFPTASYFVFVMTEPCTTAFMLASFVALARRRYVLGAFAAGLAGAMRIQGVAAEAGCVVAVVAWMFLEPPRGPTRWIARGAVGLLACWGTIAVSTYHWARFGDPLFYIHGHEAAFNHSGVHGLALLLHPKTETLIHAIDIPEHTAVWAGALVLFFLAGHRVALRRFALPAQLYTYVLLVLVYLISMAGVIDLWFMAGLSRYAVVAAPAFLAMGVLLSKRPVLLAVWLIITAWHSREVDLCAYIGDRGAETLRKCNASQWIDY